MAIFKDLILGKNVNQRFFVKLFEKVVMSVNYFKKRSLELKVRVARFRYQENVSLFRRMYHYINLLPKFIELGKCRPINLIFLLGNDTNIDTIN